MTTKIDGIALWHKFVREQDEQILAEALADDVLFHSPFIWKPRQGKAITTLYLSCAVQVLKNFTYHREFANETAVVLEFSANVNSLNVKGVDIIQLNALGQIIDFEVMVRPANGLQALGAAMMQQLTLKAPPQ